MQKKLQKRNITAIFNYSNIKLTEAMDKVLNRGLNFCILPLKLDITQVLADFRRFERTMAWQEFWFGVEQDNKPIQIFKSKKTNFPRNHKTPNSLKTFTTSVKSEIMDPMNRNKAESNLPPDELIAIKELIRLQRERIITIKPCDKGAGIIILNFEDYLKSCTDHLNSKQDGKPYYQKVDQSKLEQTKKEIKVVLNQALENQIITQSEYNAMNPDDKTAGKFYCNSKVHKDHNPGSVPPPRPIVSCCGSVTESIGLFVEHYLKPLATTHKSYIQDTPDFLRQILDYNQKVKLPLNAILVVQDVSALFTNITHEDAQNTSREALNERENQEVPTEFIICLLKLVLENNLFDFNGDLYQQLIGVSMGSRPAPPMANIFMARNLDQQILDIAARFGQMDFMKRFLDDLFSIFFGSTKRLHQIADKINQIHPNIKFTMQHTTPDGESEDERCPCEPKYSVPFLDTSLSIKDGQMVSDLYRKPTDTNKYLLPDSCHSNTCKANIPFSLFLRITRICSENTSKEKRYQELEQMLIDRDYPSNIIENAMKRARTISREVALRPTATTTTTRRPVWVVSWDPRLPSLQAITKKHWRTMKLTDPYLEEVFPEPPLIAYKRQKNIRDFLIRAKVPQKLNSRPQRKIPGMKKCNKQCHACPYIKQCKEVKNSNFQWKIRDTVNCESSNIVYLIECQKDKCKEKYIGESHRKLKDRIQEHKGYVNNRHLNQPTGYHFNQPGHTLSDMKIVILEKVQKHDTFYRKEREKYLIRKFNTYNKGMNGNQGSS